MIAMKSAMCVIALGAILLVATDGCKKHPPKTTTQDRYGIGVDWPKLDSDFRDSDPAVQAAAATIKRSILYRQFPKALTDLERLSANPSLTEAQKKTLSDLHEQTQQVMAKAAAAPPAQ